MGETMNEIVQRFVASVDGLDFDPVSARLRALDAVAQDLPRLAGFSTEDWIASLREVAAEVEDLREDARVAKSRCGHGESLHQVLAWFGSALGGLPKPEGEWPSELPARAPEPDLFDAHIASAASTREAILRAMERRPGHRWTALALGETLDWAGRRVTRGNIHVTLRRLEEAGAVRKVRRGTYMLADGTDASTSPTEPADQSRTDAEAPEGNGGTEPRRISGRGPPSPPSRT